MDVCAGQMHAIHNTWRNFEEPNKFLPERWQAPGAEYARPLKGGELAPTSGEAWNCAVASGIGTIILPVCFQAARDMHVWQQNMVSSKF